MDAWNGRQWLSAELHDLFSGGERRAEAAVEA